jgi:hypothetical protein
MELFLGEPRLWDGLESMSINKSLPTATLFYSDPRFAEAFLFRLAETL